jgi:hypothetical protein
MLLSIGALILKAITLFLTTFFPDVLTTVAECESLVNGNSGGGLPPNMTQYTRWDPHLTYSSSPVQDRIERFTEGQAFLQSYDSAPNPPPPPSPSVTQRKTEKERQFADGREGGEGGRGAESYDRKEAWSSINRSIISNPVRCGVSPRPTCRVRFPSSLTDSVTFN